MPETDDTRHATPTDTPRHDATDDMPRGVPPDTPPDPSAVVLQIEAARIAGVSVRTIQRAIDRGALPAERQGGRCWVRRDDLDRWQRKRMTPRASRPGVVRDTEASPDATRGVPPVATWHVTAPQAGTPDVARLQSEIADLKVERDRWHQAFERESALREDETRQLRLLIQQEQALSFTRFAAIEATTRHDATAADATPEPASATREDAPTVAPEAPTWRRWLRRVTGGE
jgi:excisionase family DNA binding protein